MIYRGQLTVKEQGRPGWPIRLTRDPNWGDGPATIAGSQAVTGWTRGAADPRIPEPGAVWKARLDFAPRTIGRTPAGSRSVTVERTAGTNWSENVSALPRLAVAVQTQR